MDLKMEVYTPSLELVGILEVHRSVIWEEKAFGAGSFSVDSLITDESKSLLVPGNIVWISENYAGIIEYVQEQSGKEGPYITVKGPDLTGILGQRILWGQYNLTGTAPAIMHSLVNDSCISPTRGDTDARKIPGLVSLDVPIGGDAIRVQKTGGTLLEALEELGAAFGVAFGVRFNPAVPRMEFWTRWGQNLSINQDVNDPVFYSTELDDVLSSEYSYNAQDYRNVALVAGEGEGGDRVMVTVNKEPSVTPTPTTPVGFVVVGDTSAMRTSDGKSFKAVAITADGESYQSAYTGPQIDEAVRIALSGGGGGSSGVSSFNGRTGSVIPQTGDYSASQVSFSNSGLSMTATNVQSAISELFTSVSNGKSLVASAITDKGVPTATDATFQTMHDNILEISGGGSCSPFQVAASETTVFVGVIVVSGICKQYQNIKGAI